MIRFIGIFFTNKVYSYFVVTIALFTYPILGSELVIRENSYGLVDLKESIYVHSNPNDVSECREWPHEDDVWTPLNSALLYGRFTAFAYWYKIDLKNFAENQYLVFDDPQIDLVDVYFVKDLKLIKHVRSGDALVFEEREIKIPNYYFSLPKDNYTCYFRITKDSNFTFNLKIASLKYLTEERHHNSLFFGIYFGVLFLLIFFNYFVYLYVKEKFLLNYIFYLSSILFFTASLRGYSFEYLWSNKPIYNFFFPSYGALIPISIALFVLSLLQTKTILLRLTRGVYLFILIFIVGIISNFYRYAVSSAIIQYFTLIFTVYLIFVGIQSHRKGNKVAKFFLCSWTMYLSCLIIFIIHHNGLIVSNEFTRNAIIYGSFVEAISLSFVSAYRLKISRIEKDQALLKLKIYQSELVHSEIMNSLGKMSAGICHKINNNIQISGGNISIIDRNISFLKKYFDSIDLKFDNANDTLKKLITCRLHIEKNEIFKELSNSLLKVQQGINRTAEITNGLKYFSKSDADRSVMSTHINRDISSMILLQRTLLPGTIKVDLDLGKLPEIHCKAKDLNQSFLSVFETAVNAIRDKPLPNKGVIKVKTQLENECILISFEDDGVPMEQEAIKNVFKPFQLNRIVGNKGLGLSMAYTIVRDHGGDILVKSMEGGGSIFTIVLPLK